MATKKKLEEKPRIRAYVIQDDYNRNVDIGVYTVDETEHETRNHHWVEFPNGQLRRWFFRRDTTVEDADIMEAFDMLPRLKVRYRPISKFLSKSVEASATVFFIFLFLLIIESLILFVASYYWGNADEIVSTGWTMIVTKAIWWIFCISSFTTAITQWGNFRYHSDTRDDAVPREWFRQKEREKSQGDGWI